jgi:hypothetical protein
MKTPYEHRAKYGFHYLLFGKPSKRARLMYWLLLGLLLLINIAYILNI